ncbi:MAG TPA: hypothetical protein VK906_05500 [Egicoccus sp.]|nr:hypothetical protein [Egicoccus sp.]HSK22605.1 hypothetical protein [Egicoccus sp.]
MTQEPTNPPPAAAPTTGKPWWKRWWGITLIAIVVLGVLGNLAGDDDAPSEEPQPAATEDTDTTSADPAESEEPEPAGAEEPDPAPSDEDAAGEPAPDPEPEPEPEPVGIGDGTYTVGEDLAPGTYRSEGSSMCYWARLAGFSGELGDIITNGNASTILTIAEGDVGFETSGCGDWVAVEETFPATPTTEFEDGTYAVDSHIAPGRYRADAASDTMCYWARLSDFSHELSGIITNGNSPTTIEIAAGDAGFETSGCGSWTRQ